MSEMLQFQVALPEEVPDSGAVSVRVLPFNTPIDYGEVRLQYEAGSIQVPDSVPLTIDHGEGVMDRVGVLRRAQSSEEALYADLEIANTQAGQELRELMRIGAVTDISAGIAYNPSDFETRHADGTFHLSGVLDHVSAVVRGAFSRSPIPSKVLAVHSAEGADMPETNEAPVVESAEERPTMEYASAEEVENLRGMVASLAAPGAVQSRGHQYATVGDMLQDVIAHARKTDGHSGATERLTSKIDGGMVDVSGRIIQFEFPAPPATSIGNGVAYDPYIPELARLLRDGRPTANLFASRPLPSEGNKVFMPATTVGNIVGYQDAQGEQLANQIQTQILTDAPKATIGGGQPVSIQAQLWTNPAYMSTVAEDLLEAYSEFINDKVVNGDRAVDTPASATGFNGILNANFGDDSSPGPNGATDIPVGGAPAAVIPLLGTAWAAVWNGSRRVPTAAIMSANMWGALLNEVDTDGRPLITNIGGPSNAAGDGNAGAPAGSLRGIPVVIDDAVGDTDIIVSSFRDALLFEDGTAQLQLTYPDVLVTDISVFGFSSLFVRRPAAFAVLSGITIP